MNGANSLDQREAQTPEQICEQQHQQRSRVLRRFGSGQHETISNQCRIEMNERE
jgi:hypothetical protein